MFIKDKILFVVAATSMFLFAPNAIAMTYDINANGVLGGSITGTITLDATGKITSEDIKISEPLFFGASHTFTNAITNSAPNSGGWVLVADDRSGFLALVLGYNGSSWNSPPSVSINPAFSYFIAGGLPVPDYFSGKLTADVSATPLPAALPLFVGGLSALGLLGWRRKRKTVAVAV
jgi:hypothetical protein